MAKKRLRTEEENVKLEHDNNVAKMMRSMKKYCITAYKEYLKIRHNEGNKIEPEELSNGSLKYTLTTNPIIEKIYGKITITMNNGIIDDVEPKNYFLGGYQKEYHLYKGVFIDTSNKVDKFKVDLCDTMIK